MASNEFSMKKKNVAVGIPEIENVHKNTQYMKRLC